MKINLQLFLFFQLVLSIGRSAPANPIFDGSWKGAVIYGDDGTGVMRPVKTIIDANGNTALVVSIPNAVAIIPDPNAAPLKVSVVSGLTPQFTTVPYLTQIPLATVMPTSTPIVFPTMVPYFTAVPQFTQIPPSGSGGYTGVSVVAGLTPQFTEIPQFTAAAQFTQIIPYTPLPTWTPVALQNTYLTQTVGVSIMTWATPMPTYTAVPTATGIPTPVPYFTQIPLATPGGAVSGPTLVKGTQGASGFSSQDLKDSGRVNLQFYAIAAAAGTSGTETAITLTKASDTSATSTGTSFVITSGKRFRITSISYATRGHATATLQTTTFNFRINTAGAVTTSSTPIVFPARVATTAVASAWERTIFPIPDGMEFLGNGTIQFGITAAATYATNAPTWDVTITGFEY